MNEKIRITHPSAEKQKLSDSGGEVKMIMLQK